MASKALFHSRMAARTVSRYCSGTLRSIQKVTGLTGSETSAAASFFSSRQRVTMRWRGVCAVSSLKFSTVVVKWPMRASARRAAMGVAGNGDSE